MHARNQAVEIYRRNVLTWSASTTLWRWSWLAVFMLAVFMRPAYPLDETRYLAVAWEMWRDGHVLLPNLNGLPYPDKPPLLFWLWQAGWSVFGVNEAWPRFVTAAFMGASAWSLQGIAHRLWPQRAALHEKIPLVFATAMSILLYTQMLMFDSLVVFFTLASWYALIAAPRAGLTAGLLTGLGMLAKGPIILVYVLPLLLLSPGITASRARVAFEYLGSSMILPVVWLSLLMLNGHGEFVQELFFGQISQRVGGEIGHGRPVWWYLPLVPLVLLPWTLLPQTWRRLWVFAANDRDILRLLQAAGLSMLALSRIGGKQAHYLLPLVATVAPVLARTLHRENGESVVSLRSARVISALFAGVLALPSVLAASGFFETQEGMPRWWPALLPLAIFVWSFFGSAWPYRRQLEVLGLVSVLACVGFLLITVPVINRSHDLREAALLISEAQKAGLPVAYLDNYQGEFDFFGRLQEPVEEIPESGIVEWQEQHPEGLIVAREKHAALVERRVIYSQAYRSGELFIFAPAIMPEPGQPIAMLIQFRL